MFSNVGQNLVEAMRQAATMPQPSTEEGRQAFQRIKELIAAATDHIPAPSDVSVTYSHAPRNSGLNHHTDLTDGHTIILNAIKVLPHGRATMAAAKEAVGEEVVVGILPMGEIMKTVGLTTTLGVATTLMARVTPVAMGEIQRTGLNQHHVLSRMTHVTW